MNSLFVSIFLKDVFVCCVTEAMVFVKSISQLLELFADVIVVREEA